ncbi:MAG: SurA N-terminal domain-containing protein [Kangiellaceae bacterium]|nr:SurA N-terminal domain-containing protein [Kangiellaceae bacterium]
MDSIREGVKKPWAKILIFVIVISFVGAGYFTSAFLSGDPYAAAVVNGESVRKDDFDRAYSRTRQQYGEAFKQFVKTDEQERNFRENVLQDLISRTVTLQAAQDLGMRVSTAQIRKTIREIPAIQLEGVYSEEMLDRALLNLNMSREKFKQSIVSDLVLGQLISGISSSEFLLPQETESSFQLQGQLRSGRALPIKYSLFDAGLEITDEEIDTFYQAKQELYRIEEKVSVDYLELTLDSLQTDIEVSEQGITDFYEENIERYKTEEQKRVSHILVASESDDAEKKAIALKARLTAGEAFAEVVKESSDEFSAGEGGDLGFLVSGDMEESFEDAVKLLQVVGDISEPVKTSFGYHIIKLTELTEGETQPLDDVKEQIVIALKKQGAEEAFYEKSRVLEEKSFEITDSLVDVSKQINVEIKTSPLFGRRAATGVFANQEVKDAAFGENVVVAKMNSSVISIGENHVLVLRINTHKPSEIKPIDDVRTQVVASLKSTKAKVAATAFGDTLKEKLSKSEDVSELIALKGLAWKDLDKIARTSAALPYLQLQQFFKMVNPADGVATIEAMPDNSEYVVLVLNAIEAGNVESADKASVSQATQRLTRFYSDANYSSLIAQQRSEADVTLNLDNISR